MSGKKPCLETIRRQALSACIEANDIVCSGYPPFSAEDMAWSSGIDDFILKHDGQASDDAWVAPEASQAERAPGPFRSSVGPGSEDEQLALF